AYSLKYLLRSRDYPGNLDVFYPQSYSVTRFLVGLHGRRTFLAFLQHGMDYDWDEAVNTYYGYDDVPSLERAWRKHLKGVEARLSFKDAARRFSVALSPLVPKTWVGSMTTLARVMPSAQKPDPEVVAMPQQSSDLLPRR